MRDCGVLTNAAVAVEGDRIAAVGARAELERTYERATIIDCGGGVLTPGLVDSHTHAIFGKPRYEEQERRAAGADYMEIARQGGGIHSSVRDLRARDSEELLALARPRLARLASYGTTTVEVKSGYGLSIEDELKILRVIRRLASEMPMRIVPTWLGAHEIPKEARATPVTRASYVKMLREEMLPLVTSEHLAVFADVFCEPGVFTIDETRELLRASRAAGLKLKLHADELAPSGGAELAAELRATSADHLAAISAGGIQALAAGGHRRHAASRHDALPGQGHAPAGARAARCRRRRRTRNGFQPRNVADAQPAVHPHARRERAAHERFRGVARGNREWRRRARTRRRGRTARTGLLRRPCAVRHRGRS